MTSKSTLSFIARNKLRFFVGMSFLSVIISVFTFLTFAKVWASTFEYYGIPPIAVYISIPTLLLFFSWYSGYWYEMNRMWEYEVSHLNQNVNVEFGKMITDIEQQRCDIKEIKKMLQEKK